MRRRPTSPSAEGPSAGSTSADQAAARNRALRLLTRREHGAKELRRKLVDRGIDPAQAATTVDALAAAGWQSDARYVESLIRQRIMQGYGPLRIDAELDEAGVERVLVAEALGASAPDWRALAIAVHARRFGTVPATAGEWQKRYRFLAGRGFDGSQIRAALKHMPDEETGA